MPWWRHTPWTDLHLVVLHVYGLAPWYFGHVTFLVLSAAILIWKPVAWIASVWNFRNLSGLTPTNRSLLQTPPEHNKVKVMGCSSKVCLSRFKPIVLGFENRFTASSVFDKIFAPNSRIVPNACTRKQSVKTRLLLQYLSFANVPWSFCKRPSLSDSESSRELWRPCTVVDRWAVRSFCFHIWRLKQRIILIH